MKPAMYLFINRGLGMSPGKIAAQAGHAAVEATLVSHPLLTMKANTNEGEALWNAWRKGLHYAKYVMEARDTAHLTMIERYLNDRGFRTVLIIDEGHTEIDPITPTALGVALVDKDDEHTKATFSSFKLYKEPRPVNDVKPELPAGHGFVWGDSFVPFTLAPPSDNQCRVLDLDSAREERRSRRLGPPIPRGDDPA